LDFILVRIKRLEHTKEKLKAEKQKSKSLADKLARHDLSRSTLKEEVSTLKEEVSA
jgi:hypothetical protein